MVTNTTQNSPVLNNAHLESELMHLRDFNVEKRTIRTGNNNNHKIKGYIKGIVKCASNNKGKIPILITII